MKSINKWACMKEVEVNEDIISFLTTPFGNETIEIPSAKKNIFLSLKLFSFSSIRRTSLQNKFRIENSIEEGKRNYTRLRFSESLSQLSPSHHECQLRFQTPQIGLQCNSKQCHRNSCHVKAKRLFEEISNKDSKSRCSFTDS